MSIAIEKNECYALSIFVQCIVGANKSDKLFQLLSSFGRTSETYALESIRNISENCISKSLDNETQRNLSLPGGAPSDRISEVYVENELCVGFNLFKLYRLGR